MTNTKILLKLEQLIDTLEGAAHFCEETAEQHFGHIASRQSGMAYAYNDAAKDLIHLIDDIKGEQQ